MTPPHSRITGNTLFATYVLGYALSITALVIDIHRGGALLTVLGFVSCLGLSTHLLYQLARAMAFNPMGARLAPVPVRCDRRELAA
jgi:hypothetical protein